MRQFKAFKSVCKRCMEVTRIPLSHNCGPGYDRDPIEWYESDEERWSRGKVQCPQAGGEAKPMRQFCLKYKEVDAMNDGRIFVWEETEIKS